MHYFGWLSLLPPLIAILLAIKTRQVYFSLLLGIWLGWMIYYQWNPLRGAVGALAACVDVFLNRGRTEVIVFSLLIGALITLTQRSGGMEGFINLVVNRGLIRGRRSAGLFSYIVGFLIFIESNITCLIVGAISRPIYDRLKISREKLAYICDSTSAPVCIMIPLNAWGALVLGLLSEQGVERPVWVLINALPRNFYAIFALLLVLTIVLTQRDYGPMAKAERRARVEGKVLRDGATPMVSTEVIAIERKGGVPPRAYNMLIPIGTMIGMMPLAMYITGNGKITQGSGSTSVLWAVSAAILVACFIYLVQRLLSLAELSELILKGMAGLVPLAFIMVLAFAIGNTCQALGTGEYAARVVSLWLSPWVIPLLIFLTACFISFSTGTSWGTFAILVPLGVPIARQMGIDLSLVVAAILSGGIFGDHCSPISDTTIISSMASASDHIDHVQTQLPYAMTAAVVAVVLFLLFGLLS